MSQTVSRCVKGRPGREPAVALSDGGTLGLSLVHGTGADAGRWRMHRVTMDGAGCLRSGLVGFYDRTVKQAEGAARVLRAHRPGFVADRVVFAWPPAQ
jgi:hypothetical protein